MKARSRELARRMSLLVSKRMAMSSSGRSKPTRRTSVMATACPGGVPSCSATSSVSRVAPSGTSNAARWRCHSAAARNAMRQTVSPPGLLRTQATRPPPSSFVAARAAKRTAKRRVATFVDRNLLRQARRRPRFGRRQHGGISRMGNAVAVGIGNGDAPPSIGRELPAERGIRRLPGEPAVDDQIARGEHRGQHCLRLAHDPEKWEPVFGRDHAHAKC